MAGAGYKLVDKPKVLVSADGSMGAAFEKLEGLDATTHFALQSTERVEWKIGEAATLLEKGSGLWKADDFGDAYYRGELGVTTTLAKRLDLKVAFVDDYKTRPSPGLEKNDTSFIVAFLFKP
jgi:putative salt-induced outer membrane protein YdiY